MKSDNSKEKLDKFSLIKGFANSHTNSINKFSFCVRKSFVIKNNYIINSK